VKESYTVAQLIELLKTAPQNAIVYISDDCCGCWNEANDFSINVLDNFVTIGSEGNER
jgi:hypothetical protein